MAMGGPASERVADRLAAAHADAIVGRGQERARLAELVQPGGPVAVFVHGAGGIGKTVLVGAVVRDLGAAAVTLDARTVEPTPARVLDALAVAVGAEADLDEVVGAWATRGCEVLVLDAYERFAMVDGWVRNELLPRLPATSTTVFVGRNPPNVAWRSSPGWRHLIAELPVGPLTEADAAALVARREARADIAAKVLHFGRGHPLALELAIEAFARHPDLELRDGPPPEVVEELLDVLLDDLEPSARRLAEAVSVLRRITEPLLAAVLGDDEGSPAPEPEVEVAWRVARDLPFTTVRPGGLELNGVVRDVVARGLELRAPGRARELRRRAARAALQEVGRAPGWDATADLLHLVQNPVVRDAFHPRAGLQHPVEDARPEDGDGVAAIAAAWEGPAGVELLAEWWRRHPEAFRVLRGPDGEVRAFGVVRPAEQLGPELAAADPVCARVMADLVERPLPPGRIALVLRRTLAASTGEATSAELAPMIIDVKRTYLELRPALTRVYAVVADWPARAPAMRPMGFARLEGDVAVADASMAVCALDFGPGSVDDWLARHVEVESTAPEAARTAPVASGAVDGMLDAAAARAGAAPSAATSSLADLATLSARELEVLAALAEGLTNRELADRLFISERTANRHLSNIFTKLGVHNRTAAARLAVQAGLA
jgi:DNA-binding CsgD family transcriptional regulator